MKRILLLEPDRLLAETYARALRHAGFSVVPCASAQAAILAADQKRPDLVVLELQLVEHSGIEFLYEFRSYAEWQDVPVLVQTQVPAGEFSGQLQSLQEQLGITGYLYKPTASLNNLVSNIRSQLGQSRQTVVV